MTEQLFSFSAFARCVAGLVLAMGLAACGRVREKVETGNRTDVVAVVAGAEISADALARELARRGKTGVADPPTLEQKLAVLEILVRDEAVFAKAKAAGFAESPQMQAEIRRLVVSRFQEKNFAPKLTPPSPAEVEASYRENAAKYATPGAVRGAMIFLPTPATATPEKRAEARTRAEAVLEEARGATDAAAFAQVVARHSADQGTRYRGGELAWLTRDSQEADGAVTEALFAVAKPGEFAPLVETPRGFYLVKLLERRETGTKPLAQVEEAIRYALARDKADQAEREFFATMKKGLDIQINREAIDALALPAEKTSAPPRMPGAAAPQAGK